MALGKKNTPSASRLQQAYVALMFAEESDGSRVKTVARYGAFEVRLVELRHARTGDDTLFWIELYRHDTQTSLDSCRCDDLDHAEAALQYLVSCARRLHQAG
jgi:hypothetical protein